MRIRFLCARPCLDCDTCADIEYGLCSYAADRFYWSMDDSNPDILCDEASARAMCAAWCRVADEAPIVRAQRTLRDRTERKRRTAEAAAWEGVRILLPGQA